MAFGSHLRRTCRVGKDHIGAHLVGHSGEELINIFALAMAHGITAGDIKNKIYAYPTFSSDIKNLL
jgi:glutathione reductase (NADPH)